MKTTTENLTKSDLNKIIVALTFWMAEIVESTNNKKSIEVQQEYKKLFLKAVKMKNSII